MSCALQWFGDRLTVLGDYVALEGWSSTFSCDVDWNRGICFVWSIVDNCDGAWYFLQHAKRNNDTILGILAAMHAFNLH